MAERGFLKMSKRFLKDYRHSAKIRGLPWTLSETAFMKIVAKDCHYCGQPAMRQVKTIDQERRLSKEKLNGIDRLNSSLGYSPSNCVPCCKNCNWAKNTLSELDFIEHVKKILKHWRPSGPSKT